MDYGPAHPLHLHSLIGSILKVMDDATHNEDECRTTYVSLDSAKSLFLRLTDSQGFAPQRFSQLVSSTESFTNKFKKIKKPTFICASQIDFN